MISYVARSDVPPQSLWPWMAEPGRWRRWAPHLLGTRGLGAPEVQARRWGVVLVAPGLVVPVRIVDKHPGRDWSWSVGPVSFRHEVLPDGPAGSLARIEVVAPGALETMIRLTYGPLIRLFLANLVRVAGD